MYNDIVGLCKVTCGVDEYGNAVEEISPARSVPAQVRSIGMREFYAAATAGMMPECAVILADYRNYDDEPIVLWEGRTYRVLKTYRVGKKLELTLSRKIKDVSHE